MPELQARQKEVTEQLELERAREAEILSSDQDQLVGLREAIAEQEYARLTRCKSQSFDIDYLLQSASYRLRSRASGRRCPT